MRQLSHQLYYKIFSSSLQLQELPIRTPCIEIIIDWSSYNKDTDLGLAIDARAPFFPKRLYTLLLINMREYACAQESHPALSMRHACPSSDSSNTTASHNSSSFAILFPRRGHYHQSTPDQEGTNIPLLPPSGPPAALLFHIVNNNIHYNPAATVVRDN